MSSGAAVVCDVCLYARACVCVCVRGRGAGSVGEESSLSRQLVSAGVKHEYSKR